MITQQQPETSAAKGTGLVLMTLASAQFLMTLDSSVMNVSIATVAQDVGTTITGIQSAITLYTLVMATLMLTGGKIGAIIGRRRAFAIGLVIYAAGSLTTALAPNLGILILGWSFLEGIGAALIMPAVVALVAVNFPPERRPSAYGLIAAAGAIAVAAGPLIGGAFTTYASWRYVFVGEVVIAFVILALTRRIQDAPSFLCLDWVWQSSACCVRVSGDGSPRRKEPQHSSDSHWWHGSFSLVCLSCGDCLPGSGVWIERARSRSFVPRCSGIDNSTVG